MSIPSEIKAITITIIFEASALNRDDKIGGSVLSIKKLTRDGNKTFSYLSKVSLRHHLYNSLNILNSSLWEPTPCSNDKDVVQFDLSKASIFNYAELDTFGYMFTKARLTRKAPLGITKAVALEEWEGDMQFNANHDLVKRAMANPNPVNKEEHLSYYKASFTLDVEKLGNDTWIADSYKYENNKLSVYLKDKKDDNSTPISDLVELEIQTAKGKKTAKGKDKKNDSEEIVHNFDAVKNSEFNYSVKNNSTDIGTIEIKELKNKKQQIELKLNDDEKIKRIKDIMTVIKNGIMFHSGGENYGIVPVFIISAGLKMPVPLFNSFAKLKSFDEQVLSNDYIVSDKLLFIQNSQNIVGHIENQDLYSNWKNYLKNLGITND